MILVFADDELILEFSDHKEYRDHMRALCNGDYGLYSRIYTWDGIDTRPGWYRADATPCRPEDVPAIYRTYVLLEGMS